MKIFREKGPTNLLIGLTLVICLLALGGWGVKTFFFDKLTYEVPTIPYPLNSTKLVVTPADLKETPFNKPALADLKVEILKVRGQNAEQVFNSYKTQLEEAGWNLSTNENYYYFRKGNKNIAISTTPEDVEGLAYLGKIAPNLHKQVELNDVLLTIVHGSYENLLRLEY